MSSAPADLDTFVRDALLRGHSRDAVAARLRDAGWPSEQVTVALDAYVDSDFDVPVPRPRASLSAREAFLYLVLFTALYLSAFNLGAILFQLINHAFPDAAAVSYPYAAWPDQIRSSVATLIVAFPLFLWVGNYIGRQTAANPALRLSPVRRWCTYLTLFVAVASLIGDATALVHNVLGGELTTRFLLKVLAVAGIAGAAIGYYLRDLRHGERDSLAPATRVKLPAVMATGVVVATLLAAIIALGRPARQRQQRLDERRAQTLENIASAVDAYWSVRKTLPVTVDSLVSSHTLPQLPRDPETAATYQYEVTGPKSFRLCAVFDQPSDSNAERSTLQYVGGRSWYHSRGRTCFELAVREPAR